MKHPIQCAKCFRVCRLSDSGKTWVCTICKHREKANGGRAVKGTPMVDAMMKFCFGTDEEFVRIKDAAKLERELNAANQRIKRLEEAGDAMDKTAEPFVLDTIDEEIPMSDVGEQYEITYDSPPTAGDHVAMDRARKEWRKAKEAKP